MFIRPQMRMTCWLKLSVVWPSRAFSAITFASSPASSRIGSPLTLAFRILSVSCCFRRRNAASAIWPSPKTLSVWNTTGCLPSFPKMLVW